MLVGFGSINMINRLMKKSIVGITLTMIKPIMSYLRRDLKELLKLNCLSDELKKEVKTEALQYEGRNGYYCPETKVRVGTCFGKIKSAKIMSFRNSEIDKKVNFSSPTKIPLEKVNGKLEILKPFILRLWN